MLSVALESSALPQLPAKSCQIFSLRFLPRCHLQLSGVIGGHYLPVGSLLREVAQLMLLRGRKPIPKNLFDMILESRCHDGL